MRIFLSMRNWKRWLIIGALLQSCMAPAFASTGQQGAGIQPYFKDAVSKSDIATIADGHKLVTLGDGTGPNTAKAFADLGNHPGLYAKASGIKPSDPLWLAAQPYLWRDGAGNVVWHFDRKWAYLDVQNRATEIAQQILIPRIVATLASAPGAYASIFWDNVGYQDQSLFLNGRPDNFDAAKYHAGTLGVVHEGKLALTDLNAIVNGWNGGAPAGLRGEAYASNSDIWGVYFEGYKYKAAKDAPNTHFTYDRQGLIDLLAAGKVVIVDEPGVPVWGPHWRDGFADFLQATAANPGNAYFNMSYRPFGADQWWR